MLADDLLKQGKLAEALADLQKTIRANPADTKLRVFLFQLYCVLGEWDRALTQLNLAAEADAEHLLMAQAYREILACETFRAEVFSGARTPLLFGKPSEWMGQLVHANTLLAAGKIAEAETLRARAFDAAPTSAGTIDGHPFEWLADADNRFGPVLEAIINGKYFWVPFASISEITIEATADLRDLVWAPAQFTFANEGKTVGFIPSRYPGTEKSTDDALRLARKTDWQERSPNTLIGLGQRLLATDADEYPLLQTRVIKFTTPPPEAPHAG